MAIPPQFTVGDRRYRPELVAVMGEQAVILLVEANSTLHPSRVSLEHALLYIGDIGDELDPQPYTFQDVLRPWRDAAQGFDAQVGSLVVPDKGRLTRTLSSLSQSRYVWKPADDRYAGPINPLALYDCGPRQYDLTMSPEGRLRATQRRRKVIHMGELRYDDAPSEVFVLNSPADDDIVNVQTVELYAGDFHGTTGVARRMRLHDRYHARYDTTRFVLETDFGGLYTAAFKGHPAYFECMDLVSHDPAEWEFEYKRFGQMSMTKRS